MAENTAIPARTSAFVHLIASNESSSSETLLAASSHQEWIVDSGATRHMTPVKKGLDTYSPIIGKIYLGDDSSLPILGVGNLDVIPNGSGGSHTSAVLHVPGLHYNCEDYGPTEVEP